jgi:hypothetical protein
VETPPGPPAQETTPVPARASAGRVRPVLLITAGLLVMVAGGTAIALFFIRGDEPTDVPPARTVAGAYWTAVQRKDLSAMRRVLCDDDRLLLAALDERTLTQKMFPAGRRVLGYTITGQQDEPTAVVFVQVIREDGGRVHTVTRPTPVIEKGGMFMVCFHSVGLYPGT